MACESHSQTEAEVERRWQVAERIGGDPAACWCCGGPTANAKTLLCRRCE